MGKWQKYEYQGAMRTIHSISLLTGIGKDTLRRKLNEGMTIDEIVSTTKVPAVFVRNNLYTDFITYEDEKNRVFSGMVFTGEDNLQECTTGAKVIFAEWEVVKLYPHHALCRKVGYNTLKSFRYDDITKGYKPYHRGKAIVSEYDIEFSERGV